MDCSSALGVNGENSADMYFFCYGGSVHRDMDM